MDLTVRPIVESEFETFRAKLIRGFGGDPHAQDDPVSFRKIIELERTVAAFDGDELVGTGGAFTFDLTVPGGTLPMGGTTIITVQPTHRRRGVLRAMMTTHLDEIRERGEPLAGLWASESSIYGRFGYGQAADLCQVKLDVGNIRFRGDPPAGEVRLVEPGEVRPKLEAVYERVRSTRPGMLTRSDAWWTGRIMFDPEHWRDGRSSKRFAVYTGPAGADGYAIYRQKEKWNEFPEGEVKVLEVMAATPDAHEALWRYLTQIDLFPKVEYWNLPVDDELPWRVVDPRRVQRYMWDALWIRLIDIPRALEGRSYRAEGRLVFGVHDPFMPDNDGRYVLEAGPGGATCSKTSDDADLELDVNVLGALYLGGQSISTLAKAGLVHGDSKSVATAGALFAWDPQPWCPEVF